MQSIYWVDRTYIQKHKSENPDTLRAMYYPNLVMYPTKGGPGSTPKADALLAFFNRYAKRVGILVGVYLISCLPYIGRYVLPAASYYTFSKHVGSMPATVIFCVGLVLPKVYLVRFMHTYFASRSLMRELVSFLSLSFFGFHSLMSRRLTILQLQPYFRRVKFTPEQKQRWFRDREGVLFGFAFGFAMILKTPFIGVLMYGVAEASTAYLVTKITDPPPPPASSEGFAESQVTWANKHDFLQLSLDKIDNLNVSDGKDDGAKPSSPSKKFS